MGCEKLKDTELVDTAVLFEGYFAGKPPFGTDKKKFEFPDALALNALERAAEVRGIGILVVSKDKDWRNFCDNSSHLYIVENIESALALVASAPPALKKSVIQWIDDKQGGYTELMEKLTKEAEEIEHSVDAYPSFGECEMDVWAGELQSIEWPEEGEMDIIDFGPSEEGESFSLVMSLPLELNLRVTVDFSFSIWDSVDKESVPMGGRTIEHDEKINVQATITFYMHKQGMEHEELQFVDAEIDDKYFELYLGEIDVYEPEDYGSIDEGPAR